MGVNIHWQKWDGEKIKKHVKMLEIKPYAFKSKNAENWQRNLQETVVKYKIYDGPTGEFDQRLVSFVTDGEAAILKCLRDGLKCCYLRCGCHQTSIILKNGFSNSENFDGNLNGSQENSLNAMQLEVSSDSGDY